MEAKFTKGPWQVLETEPDRAMDYVGETFVRAANGATLATLSNYSPAERRANAALMADAPELLNTLRAIELASRSKGLTDEERKVVMRDIGETARAAIAKALGA